MRKTISDVIIRKFLHCNLEICNHFRPDGSHLRSAFLIKLLIYVKQKFSFFFLTFRTCWEIARLTSYMTTTEQDYDTSTRNHAKHELALRWPTILPGWVITRVGPGEHPQYTRAHYLKAVGGSTVLSTPIFIQQDSGAAVLVVVEQERSASVCNSVFACGCAASENKTTFEAHCEANGNFLRPPVQKC